MTRFEATLSIVSDEGSKHIAEALGLTQLQILLIVFDTTEALELQVLVGLVHTAILGSDSATQ